jgi:FixJ family two-component response regulator
VILTMQTFMSDRQMQSTFRRPGEAPRRSRMVYVACDDEQICADVRSALNGHNVLMRCFRSGFEYLACERSRTESCLLIGGHLADMSGLELQRMVAQTQGPPVIFLSDQGDLPSCVRAMKAGALDFFAIPFVDTHLLDVMEAAFKKDRAALAAKLQEEELYRRWRSLTSREAEVMRYVVAGFLNKQTAGELNIAENTVQVHRGRVMRKMQADSFAALVRMSLQLESRKESVSLARTRVPHTPEFPVEFEGSREPHAPFLDERRTRSRVKGGLQEIRGISPSFGEMWELTALGPEPSTATGTLARTPAVSHISPKEGEIWGTLVRG